MAATACRLPREQRPASPDESEIGRFKKDTKSRTDQHMYHCSNSPTCTMFDSYRDAIIAEGWTKASLLVAATLLVWLLGNAISQFLRDPLKDIPGPIVTRFTRFWLFKNYAGGQFHKTNLELHKKYGSIVRIAPNQYSIDDPEAAKIIYGHGTHFTKADWYQPWGHPDFINLFNDQNPKTHAQLRRQLSQMYSMSSLVSYESFVDECVTILTNRLSEIAESGSKANIGYWLQCFAFDVIGKITFSYRFGFLDSGVDIMNLMHEIDDVNFYCSVAGVFPILHQFVSKLVQLFKLGGQGMVFVDDYAQEYLASREQEQEKAQEHGVADFLQKILNARRNEDARVTKSLVRNVAGANMVAGSDTTSISLSAVLYNLYKSPTTLAKLRMELDKNSQAGTISDPITFKEAQSLPYLQAVIKEALRMHPATGFTMPRVVPVGGVEMSGQYFPQGTVIGVNSWVAHANKSVFGDDADCFRPERWLENPELNTRRELYYFTVSDRTFQPRVSPAIEYLLIITCGLKFGQGSRTCIGKNISLLEISKTVPVLVQKFNFDVDGEAAWECRNNWFVKPTNFECRVRKIK